MMWKRALIAIAGLLLLLAVIQGVPTLGHTIGGLLLLAGAVFVYFLPSIVGRHKRNAQAILLLNLFLGWTLIGWVVALVWANTSEAGLTA